MVQTKLSISHISSPLHTAFSISRGAKTEAETVRVKLERGKSTGRGECVPYKRYGESPASVMDEIETTRIAIEGGMTRAELQIALPAGAARCAVDCAMWDLEAKETGVPVWKRANLPEPRAIETAVTIVLDTPEQMVIAARTAKGNLLKLKLGGPEDMARLEAVHGARPDARLILDANEGLNADTFTALIRQAANLGVVLIEQPFAVGQDAALLARPGAIAICADESAHTSTDIQTLTTRYDAVNIKLDKTGGLTEGLAMAHTARSAGMGIMVGCMVAGSLSMAPAVLLAGLADTADLDGPLWLSQDIKHGLVYEGGLVFPPMPKLWG